MTERRMQLKKGVILFALGILGLASLMPVLPQLVEITGESLPFSVLVLKAMTFAQSSLFLIVSIAIGLMLAPRVNLSSPILDSLIHPGGSFRLPRRFFLSAVSGGILGGLFIVLVYAAMSSHLPDAFLSNAARFQLPVYSRVLYGGFTEEILVRWGLMTVLVWGLCKVFGKKTDQTSPIFYLLAIVLSSLLFGVSHLPVTNLLTDTMLDSVVLPELQSRNPRIHPP